MAMKENCKHFQSRTYSNGEAARFCVLGLAPEAPWRCPENCPKFEPRLADVGWVHGSLIEPPLEDEPIVGDKESMMDVLNQAEQVVESQAVSDLTDQRPTRIKAFIKKFKNR